jgi:hypothetical protein
MKPVYSSVFQLRNIQAAVRTEYHNFKVPKDIEPCFLKWEMRLVRNIEYLTEVISDVFIAHW